MDKETLLERLKSASAGERVWRIMEANGKAYFLEFGFSDSANPASEAKKWLIDNQSRGFYSGCYVTQTVRLDEKDRLIHEAITEIVRLRKIEQNFQESIQMRTRE